MVNLFIIEKLLISWIVYLGYYLQQYQNHGRNSVNISNSGMNFHLKDKYNVIIW